MVVHHLLLLPYMGSRRGAAENAMAAGEAVFHSVAAAGTNFWKYKYYH
jgi:hypothetical protein